MSIFSKFFKKKRAEGIMFEVECDKCGERVRVRINPKTDVDNYVLKKEILGNNCQNLIYAEIHFDGKYNILSSKITGGKIIC